MSEAGSVGDVFLVLGWKVGESALKKALEDMDPEAFDRGLRMVFPGRSMAEAFLGEILATVKSSEGGLFSAARMPGQADVERLKEALRIMGLEAVSAKEPELWTVLG